MKHNIFLFFCLFVGLIKPLAQNKKLDILLDNTMIQEAKINVKLINSIDYTPNGFLLLSSSNQFYALGIGDMPTIFSPSLTTSDFHHLQL